jgi:predicted Fe-Mo cluster-binding NifX family protein
MIRCAAGEIDNGEKNMKIAVTSKGKELDSEVDPRFGRAANILIVDSQTFEFIVLDKQPSMNALKGAGIQAATMLNDNSVQVLLTGHCGPNAFKTCTAAGIKVVNGVEGCVENAVKNFNDEKYNFAENSDVEGHW